MNNKKRIVGIMFIAVFIIGISLASAGFWDSVKDFFTIGEEGDYEGELAAKQAQAFVNVTEPTTPAEIIWVSPPYDVSSSLGPAYLGWVDLNINRSKNFTFNFLANHSSPAVLPDDGFHSPDEGDLANTYIRVNFTSPDRPSDIRPVDPTDNTACWYEGMVNYMGDDVKNYSCTVNLSYYDEPFVDWFIAVQIRTTAGTDIWSPVNRSRNFSITSNTEINVFPASVNWTVVLGANPIDALSENSVRVQNLGNVNITDTPSPGDFRIRVNATFLNGTEPGNQDINIWAGNFTVDEASEPATTACAQSRFIESMFQNAAVDVSHEASLDEFIDGSHVPDSTDINFCLIDLPIEVIAQEYNSSRMWELDLEHVA